MIQLQDTISLDVLDFLDACEGIQCVDMMLGGAHLPLM
jgi:hypothetical protein